MTILSLCEPWDLVVADFASEYGIRLAVTEPTWREFCPLLAGLLCVNSRLARHFTNRDDDGEGVDDGGR